MRLRLSAEVTASAPPGNHGFPGREHPVSCTQPTQDFCGRFDIRARISDEVSGEHNDISLEAIGLLHGFGKPFPWEK